MQCNIFLMATYVGERYGCGLAAQAYYTELKLVKIYSVVRYIKICTNKISCFMA